MVLGCNRGNLLRCLVFSRSKAQWSLCNLLTKRIEIRAKGVRMAGSPRFRWRGCGKRKRIIDLTAQRVESENAGRTSAVCLLCWSDRES